MKLSQDKLDLEDIPLFAVIQCIVFMRNISSSTVSYKWNLQHNEVFILDNRGLHMYLIILAVLFKATDGGLYCTFQPQGNPYIFTGEYTGEFPSIVQVS